MKTRKEERLALAIPSFVYRPIVLMLLLTVVTVFDVARG